MISYIHQLPEWPDFRWDQDGLAGRLAEIRHRQGRLLGRMEGLGFALAVRHALQRPMRTLVTLLGIAAALASSWVLTRTALRGEPTTFSLELPPYRPPRLLSTLYTSLVDRTLIVLWRAVVFAAPAGAAIWLVGNVEIGGRTLAHGIVELLDPVGLLIGLNGVILLAYVVAIPANEIVIPTILMLTVLTRGIAGVGSGAGVMFELDQPQQVEALLRGAGWTALTGINLMLFSLFHNPCSTTIYTIYKETGSARWTAVSVAMPLAIGFALCFVVAQVARWIGWV